MNTLSQKFAIAHHVALVNREDVDANLLDKIAECRFGDDWNVCSIAGGAELNDDYYDDDDDDDNLYGVRITDESVLAAEKLLLGVITSLEVPWHDRFEAGLHLYALSLAESEVASSPTAIVAFGGLDLALLLVRGYELLYPEGLRANDLWEREYVASLVSCAMLLQGIRVDALGSLSKNPQFLEELQLRNFSTSNALD